MRRLSVIGWYGGKSLMLPYILPYLNIPHKHYVEVFGGGAAVLLNKKPSLIETYNDIDSNLVNFFRVLRDKEKTKEMKRLISLTPYSREERRFFVGKLKNKKEWFSSSDIERAYMFFYIVKTSYGGSVFGGFKSDINESRIKKDSILETINKAQKRFFNIHIENASWKKIINQYDSPNTLFYLDPPYPEETRITKKDYVFEMEKKDHKKLIKEVSKIQGKAIISTYKNDTYDQLKNFGWRLKEIEMACVVEKAKKKKKRIEQLWFSPHFEIANQKSIKNFIRR
jgi:DNA adenine methylase